MSNDTINANSGSGVASRTPRSGDFGEPSTRWKLPLLIGEPELIDAATNLWRFGPIATAMVGEISPSKDIEVPSNGIKVYLKTTITPGVTTYTDDFGTHYLADGTFTYSAEIVTRAVDASDQDLSDFLQFWSVNQGTGEVTDSQQAQMIGAFFLPEGASAPVPARLIRIDYGFSYDVYAPFPTPPVGDFATIKEWLAGSTKRTTTTTP